jgi:hypothetical protein
VEADPREDDEDHRDHQAHPAVVVAGPALDEDDDRGDEAGDAEEAPEGDPEVEAGAEDPPRVGSDDQHHVLDGRDEADGHEDVQGLGESGVPGVALLGAVLELGHCEFPPGHGISGVDGCTFLRTFSCITK